MSDLQVNFNQTQQANTQDKPECLLSKAKKAFDAKIDLDPKSKDQFSLEMQNVQGVFTLDEKPSKRIRIGTGSINTYVIINQKSDRLEASIYAMIPKKFFDWILPFLKEQKVEVINGPDWVLPILKKENMKDEKVRDMQGPGFIRPSAI